MEDLNPTDETPPHSPLPEEDNENSNPLRPEVDEENSAPTPPIGAPTLDTEVLDEQADDAPQKDDSDDESALSEVDEAQFEDFDPTAIAIDERPVAIDETNVDLIGTHKRKRAEGEEPEKRKKKKEGRREKPKKNRRAKDVDDDFVGGEEVEGKRVRKKKDLGEKRDRQRQRPRSPEKEEELSPEEIASSSRNRM